MTARTYATEFPVEFHPEPELVARLEGAGWVDASWGNDINPHWELDGLELWVAPQDPSDREFPEACRFVLMRTGDENPLAVGDEIDAVLGAVNE